MQYSTPSGESNVKLMTACAAIDSIESDHRRQWSQQSRFSSSTGDVGKFARHHGKKSKYYILWGILICKITINVFRLCICTGLYDLNTQAKRVTFFVSKTLSNFRHSVILYNNKLINY